MAIDKQATRAHLFVGAALVLLSIAGLVATPVTGIEWLSISVFFFGVWGGMEIGRRVEHRISMS